MASQAQREARRRYNASPKGKAAKRKYLATPKGRETLRRSKAKWNAANKEQVRVASYKRKAGQKAIIDQIKVARGCADCGYSDHPAALEFDHITDNKEANVSGLIGANWDRVEAEIAKCEVVCANCHRIRTVERMR